MSHPEVLHEAHSHPTSQKQNRDEKPNTDYWGKLSTLHGFEEGVHGNRCVKEKNDSYWVENKSWRWQLGEWS